MRKLFSFVALVALSLFVTSCSGGIAELANNVLYPFADVNKKYPVPETPPLDWKSQNFEITSDTGAKISVHGWSHKAANPNARIFVYFHGNGENLQAMQVSGFLDVVKSLGVHFIAIDYPGLGRSTGEPNQINLTNAAVAAFDWARAQYPQSTMVIWGRSLGAAVAAQLALQRQGAAQGLILTSPWNNFLDAARALSKLADRIPKEWLAKNTYDTATAAKEIRLVTMIHHGALDKLIPIALGRIVHKSFADQSQVLFREVPGKEHNDMFTEPTLWQDIKGFIR